MAKKRMFCMEIVDSDAFMEMPASTQLLYFQLGMRADNEGFVASPRGIMKKLGSSDDDYGVLLAKGFVIKFESGICVIKHWLMHNTIRLDREAPTVYLTERSSLFVKANKAYTKDNTQADVVLTNEYINTRQLPGKCLPNLIKSNQIKSNTKKSSETSSLTPKKEKKKYGEFENVLLTDEELQKLFDRLNENNTKIIIEELSAYIASKGKRYSSHYATLLGWARRKVESRREKLSAKGKEILL